MAAGCNALSWCFCINRDSVACIADYAPGLSRLSFKFLRSVVQFIDLLVVLTFRLYIYSLTVYLLLPLKFTTTSVELQFHVPTAHCDITSKVLMTRLHLAIISNGRYVIMSARLVFKRGRNGFTGRQKSRRDVRFIFCVDESGNEIHVDGRLLRDTQRKTRRRRDEAISHSHYHVTCVL